MLPSAKGLTLEVTGSHRFEPLAWAVPNHFSTQILFWTRTSSLKWAQGSSASCFSLRFSVLHLHQGQFQLSLIAMFRRKESTQQICRRQCWLLVPGWKFQGKFSRELRVIPYRRNRILNHNHNHNIIDLKCLFWSSSFCNLVHGYKVRLHMATDRFMPFPICFPTISPPTRLHHQHETCIAGGGVFVRLVWDKKCLYWSADVMIWLMWW